MAPTSRQQLNDDLQLWGDRLRRLLAPEVTRIVVAEITGLPAGSRRVRRIVQHLTDGGPLPPPDERELEAAADDAEPPARPGVRVRQQTSDELHVEAQGNDLHPSGRGQGVVRNLDELAAQAEIDLTLWAADDFQVRTWATPMRRRAFDAGGKRAADEVVVVRSWYVSAKFRRRLDRLTSAADWTAQAPRRARAAESPTVAAVVIPDMHVGYRWARGHQALIALHDWAALDAVLQLIAIVRPQLVQNLGDGLDFAAFSTKFPVPLALRDTARPALLTAHAILRAQRAAAPDAEIDWQGGNHDDRPERGIVGTEYDGLTQASAPDGPAVLSFAHLLGLEALDVTWRAYGEHRWLFGAVMVHHGDKVKSRGGLTVAESIRDAQHSVLFGHIHRVEQASRTLHGPTGVRVITAASPGTLARIDGSVPGVSKRPDWQQGVGLVYWDEARRQEHIELVHVHDGALFWRGQRIEGDGRRLAAEVAAQIGYPQVTGT